MEENGVEMDATVLIKLCLSLPEAWDPETPKLWTSVLPGLPPEQRDSRGFTVWETLELQISSSHSAISETSIIFGKAEQESWQLFYINLFWSVVN